MNRYQSTIKYLYAALVFSVMAVNVAYAQSEDIKEPSSFNFKIIRQIFDIFGNKDTKVETSASSSSTTTLNTINQAAAFTIISTSSSSTIESLVSDNNSNATTTSSTSTCDYQTKIKKDKINKKIKTQLQDKNKLVENLLQISSSTDDDKTHHDIDEAILKLDQMVSAVIHDQLNLITELSSSTDATCDIKALKKETKTTLNKIKKLEQDINKKSNEINTFIKVDIKNILKNVASL